MIEIPGRDNGNTAGRYSAWSLNCFERRIKPLLDEADREILSGVRCTPWLSTCEPGIDSAVRSRLFPGSLLILWVEALAGLEASHGIEPVAAALECLHNASLIHDDILDNHEVRRRQPTLLATQGLNFALLGGDGLLAGALAMLGKLADDRIQGCALRLARATEEMIAGQLLDEPATWQHIEPKNHEEHWFRVCRGKLALGNVAGPLAAFWAGYEGIEQAIAELLAEFSVVSQILNDFGDTYGWTGYHDLTVALRRRGHEAAQKPTLPSIWAAQNHHAGLEAGADLLARARSEIERRRQQAVRALSNLDLEASRLALLMDFVTGPRLPADGDLEV
ncbi:MAG: class 1 isoprenoid biosynthesis enzyme [Desulfobacterales bacterium]|nr:class 1 isoprenoid biosynthesis enzyme [Desulfobacterales bacterium]